MPEFVIGIGSQRAGSTLLHRILDECTSVMMHPVKELHYFDTLHNIRAPKVLTDFSRRQLDRELTKLASSGARRNIGPRVACYLNANWLLYSRNVEDIRYESLFEPFLGEQIIGETTPEYMLMNDSQIENMAKVIGSSSKILLVTRDPIERFISAFKLLKVYGGGEINQASFSDHLINTLDSMPTWVDQQIALNDYSGAENRFSKHFDQVCVVSYEELTQNMVPTVSAVTDYIGVDVDKSKIDAFRDNRVNEIGQIESVSQRAMAILKERILS